MPVFVPVHGVPDTTERRRGRVFAGDMMISAQPSEIVMPVTGELVLDYATYRRIVFAPGGRRRWLLPVMGAASAGTASRFVRTRGST